MKRFSILFLVFYFFGCAHTRVTSYSQDEVTVCGRGEKENFDEKAMKACGTKTAQLTGGFENRTISGFSQGMVGYTGQTYRANYKTEQCLVYKCF